jgi:ABC-type Fe3+ transport system permease subunit
MKRLKIILALALAPLSLSLLPQVAYADCANPASAQEALKCGSDSGAGQSNNDPASLNKTIKAILNLLTVIIGVLSVIMIMVGGFRYVTSGGRDDAVKSAKNTITYALIGLVVASTAQIMVHFVLAKTSEATTPQCVASGKTHKWDSGPDAGHSCTP